LLFIGKYRRSWKWTYVFNLSLQSEIFFLFYFIFLELICLKFNLKSFFFDLFSTFFLSRLSKTSQFQFRLVNHLVSVLEWSIHLGVHPLLHLELTQHSLNTFLLSSMQDRYKISNKTKTKTNDLDTLSFFVVISHLPQLIPTLFSSTLKMVFAFMSLEYWCWMIGRFDDFSI